MSYGKFNITIYPDENLAAIIGSEPVPPTEMIKKIWIYIKKHGLAKKDKE